MRSKYNICVEGVLDSVKTLSFYILTRYAFLFWRPCCWLCRVVIKGARNVMPNTYLGVMAVQIMPIFKSICTRLVWLRCKWQQHIKTQTLYRHILLQSYVSIEHMYVYVTRGILYIVGIIKLLLLYIMRLDRCLYVCNVELVSWKDAIYVVVQHLEILQHNCCNVFMFGWEMICRFAAIQDTARW